MSSKSDALTEAGVIAHLKNAGIFQVEVREKVTSTNTVLREEAEKGAPEGCVLVAKEQTEGKGRLGRVFYSPGGHGAYFSLLLRPCFNAGDATLITSAAAVAAARAIEDVFGVRVGIKWVNDLFLNGKKVCGILTEAIVSAGSSLVESAVLGIGINVTMPEGGYSGDLAGIATALTGDRTSGDNSGGNKISGDKSGGDMAGGDRYAGGRKFEDIAAVNSVAGMEDGRCRLIATTLDEFWRYYQKLDAREFLDEYRARSVVLGQDIHVISGDMRRQARALAIDDDCRLIVRYENGETGALDSGEVSMRIEN